MRRSTVRSSKRATYPAYKPSGVSWLGNIPEHWEIRRLKYSADLINTKIDGAAADLPYTGLEHIESWTGKRILPNGDITSEGQANLYGRGDVLFGKLRPYLAKAHAAENDGICTGELLVLRPKAVKQKFLLDYVLNPDFVAIVDSSTYGAKMPRANWDFIGNLPALIPPPDEQQIITVFLDRETARIDALIEKKQRQIELLQEKRLALITHAVTKGLDPKVKMKVYDIEWLGNIPGHWKVMAIKFALAIPITDGPHETPEFLPDGIPFLSAESVKDDRLDFSRKRGFISPEDHARFSKKYVPKRGDVYMVKSGATTGNVARVETDEVFNIWSPLAVLRPHPAHSTTDFIFYFMKSRAFLASVELAWSYGTQQNIGMGVVSNLRIALPPLEEQKSIAAMLNTETAQSDALVMKVRDSIETLREYRTALISAAVTGKIDVRKEAS
jgi:type I restriction enzyme S subunit